MRKKLFTGQIQPKKFPPTAKNNFSRGPAKKKLFTASRHGSTRKKNYLRATWLGTREKKLFIRASARKKFLSPFLPLVLYPYAKKNYLWSFLSKKMRPPRKKNYSRRGSQAAAKKKLFMASQSGVHEKIIIYDLPARHTLKKKLFTSYLESAENPKIIFRGEL